MATLSLEDDSDPNLTHFAHKDEFMALLRSFLADFDAGDCADHGPQLTSMGAILDYYLPSPGLLDPSLPLIVPPLMDALSGGLRELSEKDKIASKGGNALIQLGKIINWVVKVRGWKAVVPYFPSGIHFLPLLIYFLSPPQTASSSTTPITPHHPLLSTDEAWELRAVLLLWLALLLTVPFDLSALSSNSPPSPYIDIPSQRLLFSSPPSEVARNVILLAIPLLRRAGKEGAYASLVLARLFSREDTVHALPGFLAWAGEEIKDGERDGEANLVASILELLVVLPTMLKPEHLGILAEFTDETLLPHLRGSRTAANSGLIRKLAIKVKGRWWMAKLGKAYKQGGDMDTPDGLEEVLDEMMSGLGDKDTIVRYSAAKYLARLASVLPATLAEQIVAATIDLFSGTDDEPVVESDIGLIVDPGGSASGGTMGFGGDETVRGEARWHGVCLALAELARRGLLLGDTVERAVSWLFKALTFDLRRASFSIGANVRDAAAYLVWSLSRACPPDVLAPLAEQLATKLVCVACLDREVGVRRAASAAFQEGVGRHGLYPEGISVLASTDFYSVSVRRIAFSTAAPAVAEHRVYRDSMREHLHRITLRHWDRSMRVLGSTTLRSILSLGSNEDLDRSMTEEINHLSSLDPSSVHGALSALTQMSAMLDTLEPRRKNIFASLSRLRPSALVAASSADILQAACELITACLSSSVLEDPENHARVQHIIQTAMRRREPECQEAVADVFERLSQLIDCEKDARRLWTDLCSTRAPIRQAAALSLGHIQYLRSPSIVNDVLVALLEQLDPVAKADVETRRYAIRSLADITGQSLDSGSFSLPYERFHSILKAFLVSLDDYSTDQRGDVGSWIRVVALAALGKTLSIPGSHDLVSHELFQTVLGGVLKQSMEKLEPVRAEAARTLCHFKQAGWQWEGMDRTLIGTVLSDEEFRYISQRDCFASAMPLLETDLSEKVVEGLVQSIGSSVASLSSASLSALVTFLHHHTDIIEKVLSTLSTLLTLNLNTNRVFLPTLHTVHKLVSSDQLPSCLSSNALVAKELVKIANTACRGIPQLKSIDRLTISMKLTIALIVLPVPEAQLKATTLIPLFLAHRFPRIRAISAEQLYLALSEQSERDMEEELEEVLLETDWVGEVGDETERVKIGLLRHLELESSSLPIVGNGPQKVRT